MIPKLVHLSEVRALPGHRLFVRFDNGAEGEADMSWLLTSDGPVVQPLKDAAEFARVFLEMGAPTWPTGFDLDPSNLHQKMKDSGALRSVGVAAE